MGNANYNKETPKSEVSEEVIPPPGEPKGAAVPSDAQNSLNVAFRYISYLNPLTIHKKGKRAKAYFALAIVCFFWGTTWLASKQLVSHVPYALQVAGLRQLFGGLCYV